MTVEIVRRPTLLDVMYIAKYAREADKKECFLLSGRDLTETFSQTPGLYSNCWVWEKNNKPVCIFGITPLGDQKGVIWLIATDDFDRYKKIVRSRCKDVFENMIVGYTYLCNYVMYKHKKAVKWLKWLGCKIYEPEPIGINGELYCKFEVLNV